MSKFLLKAIVCFSAFGFSSCGENLRSPDELMQDALVGKWQEASCSFAYLHGIELIDSTTIYSPVGHITIYNTNGTYEEYSKCEESTSTSYTDSIRITEGSYIIKNAVLIQTIKFDNIKGEDVIGKSFACSLVFTSDSTMSYYQEDEAEGAKFRQYINWTKLK